MLLEFFFFFSLWFYNLFFKIDNSQLKFKIKIIDSNDKIRVFLGGSVWITWKSFKIMK